MKKKIQPTMQNAIKMAKAINSLKKHPYISVLLFKNRLADEDLFPSSEKLYAMWNYMIANNTIRKVNRREYHWNGSVELWSDVDKANAYCLTLLKLPCKKTKAANDFKITVPVTSDVLPTIKSFSDDALAQELRARGWTVECYKQVTVNI
jgi:hypothetical protein